MGASKSKKLAKDEPLESQEEVPEKDKESEKDADLSKEESGWKRRSTSCCCSSSCKNYTNLRCAACIAASRRQCTRSPRSPRKNRSLVRRLRYSPSGDSQESRPWLQFGPKSRRAIGRAQRNCWREWRPMAEGPDPAVASVEEILSDKRLTHPRQLVKNSRSVKLGRISNRRQLQQACVQLMQLQECARHNWRLCEPHRSGAGHCRCRRRNSALARGRGPFRLDPLQMIYSRRPLRPNRFASPESQLTPPTKVCSLSSNFGINLDKDLDSEGENGLSLTTPSCSANDAEGDDDKGKQTPAPCVRKKLCGCI